MIHSKDRSYYIGASDTSYVIGNWDTKTFEKWYYTKLGLYSMDFESEAMKTGTAYEHKILSALNVPGMVFDKQIISGRMRVNLDGNTNERVYECKTINHKPTKPNKQYINQVNIQMYASNIRKAIIVFYEVTDIEYKNFYAYIDSSRLTLFDIPYDEKFVNEIYLPRFNYLSECLDKGVFPKWNLQAK